MYVGQYGLSPIKSTKDGYFSLERNTQVSTTPGTTTYKGEKSEQEIEESFHLIEPTGLYFYRKSLQFTHGSACKVLTGLHNEQLTLTTPRQNPCLCARIAAAQRGAQPLLVYSSESHPLIQRKRKSHP